MHKINPKTKCCTQKQIKPSIITIKQNEKKKKNIYNKTK